MPDGIASSQPVLTPGGFPAINGVPSFEDIFKNLRYGGEDKFQMGLQTVTPAGGIRPETQSILDLIKVRQMEDERRASSNAIALAGRRGISGSSTEQFGVSSATGEVAKGARDAEANILLQNLRREQELENLRANALFGRASEEGRFSLESGQLGIQANQLVLEQAINERAMQIAQENIGVSREIAREQAKNELLGTGIGAVTNLAAASLFGGGRNLFGGGGGGGGIPGLQGGKSLVNGQVPGMFGPGGTFLSTTPGAFMGGGFLPTLGAGVAGYGIGSMLNPSSAQTKSGQVGALAGGLLGSFFGPGGTLIGSTAGAALGKPIADFFKTTAGSVLAPFANPAGTVKSISKSVKKIFAF